MFRSSTAVCVILGVMFATIGMAAVSSYQPSQTDKKPVISETVFEQAAAPKPVIPQKNITAKPAPAKIVVPPMPVSPQPKKRRTLSTIQPEHYQDWKEADKLTLRSHQVRLTSDGMLSGRVILFDQNSGASRTINNLDITFMKAGAVFATVKPGVHGVFQASGLTSGVYGVAVTGEVGFALFTVHVFPALKHGDVAASLSPLRLEIAAIPSSDVPFVQSVFNPLASQNHSVIPTEPAEEHIPKSAHVTKEVVDSPKGSTTKGHTIHLQADGSLIGRVRRLHPESGRPFLLHSPTLYTHFLQNNRVVHRVKIGLDGRFRIPNFKQGAYSVITAGNDGVGAIGIRVVPSEQVSDLQLTPDENGLQFVTFLQPAAGSPPNFDIALLGPENFEALKNLLTPSQFADLVGGGGGLGGGGGGGGGAGSGLPLELLGLLGLLGLLASP